MARRVEENTQRTLQATHDLKQAAIDCLANRNILVSNHTIPGTTFGIQIEFNEKSQPFIPGAYKRLVRAAYTQALPVWAVRTALVHAPEMEQFGGEVLALNLDIIVHEQKTPSQIAKREGRIAVGKLEAFLSPQIMISTDWPTNCRYSIDRAPMFPPKTGFDPAGCERDGQVGAAVLEATTSLLQRLQENWGIDDSSKAGRTKRAVRAVQKMVYSRIGRPTATPRVKFDIDIPSTSLFP